MAGKPGMKGGGGARPGAGRKPKVAPKAQQSVSVELEPQGHGGALKRAKAEPVEQEEKDMLQFLQDVALGRTNATSLQVRAAIAAVQYTHTKSGDGGKKDAAADKAKKAAAGRFAQKAPPRLVVNNR